MLEVLAGLETDIVPATYQLLQIDVPDALAIDEYDGPVPALRGSQDWGMAWLEKGATPLARVPSAIVRVDRNMLINTEHPDASNISIITAKPLSVGSSAVQLIMPPIVIASVARQSISAAGLLRYARMTPIEFNCASPPFVLASHSC